VKSIWNSSIRRSRRAGDPQRAILSRLPKRAAAKAECAVRRGFADVTDFRARAFQSLVRRLISSGSLFEREIGYSRAVVDGDLVFVSGTTGFDYRSMTISDDVVEQAQQCLRNIDEALAEAGSRPGDIVRVRYILPKVEDFEPCWPVLRRYFWDIRPAATMISAGLSDSRMKIEIEVTARKTSAPAPINSSNPAHKKKL
jgi:enamine deaminase RidA (YjgF/YER057c/UK114 family)